MEKRKTCLKMKQKVRFIFKQKVVGTESKDNFVRLGQACEDKCCVCNSISRKKNLFDEAMRKC